MIFRRYKKAAALTELNSLRASWCGLCHPINAGQNYDLMENQETYQNPDSVFP
jgi:hypothetical protein